MGWVVNATTRPLTPGKYQVPFANLTYKDENVWPTNSNKSYDMDCLQYLEI